MSCREFKCAHGEGESGRHGGGGGEVAEGSP